MSVDIVEKRHAGQHTSVMSKRAGHSLGDERQRGGGDASQSPNAHVSSVMPEWWGDSSSDFAGWCSRRFSANSGSRGNSGLNKDVSQLDLAREFGDAVILGPDWEVWIFQNAELAEKGRSRTFRPALGGTAGFEDRWGHRAPSFSTRRACECRTP